MAATTIGSGAGRRTRSSALPAQPPHVSSPAAWPASGQRWIQPPTRAFRRLFLSAAFAFASVLALVFGGMPVAQAAQVQHLNTQSTTAAGAGAGGKPTLASFSIPSGKNRVLFIWSSFERDHCSPTDTSSGLCTNGNVAGTGLGDNWPEPRTGTPPATTSNNQITPLVTGPGGTISKQNALVVGGTPSGDLRFITISTSPSGSPSGTAFFSISSFHIALFEDEIDTLLGGAPSGTVSITLPDVTTPSGAGDEAILVASVFQNAEQTVNGMVRNATAIAQVTSGTPGNSVLTPAAYDAGQIPDEADDGKLVAGASASIEGFVLPAGHVALATPLVVNNAGQYDTPNGNINNEPNGFTGGLWFRNGGATPTSLYSLQMAGGSTPLTYGATNTSFLIESDNADVGDAPISYGNASHTLSGIRLGASVDADASLLNSADASGDDVNNTDDENGVTLVPLLPVGETTLVPVSIQGGAGYLNAWFDWNGDGDFADAGEQMATNQAVGVGTFTLSVPVPATAIIGPTFARFRVCTNNTALDNCSSPRGTVQSGEVEDYQFTVLRKLILRKTSQGAAGGPFSFTLTNTAQTTGSVTTATAGSPTTVDGDTASTATLAYTIVSPTSAVTITESALPAGFALSNATCVNGSGATVGSRSGTTYTLTGAEIAASTAFTCTFTNGRLSRLTVAKTAIGGGGSFPFTVSGGLTPATFGLNPNPPGTPTVTQVFNDVTPGTPIVITENPPSTPNWTLAAINCTDASGAPTGSTVSTSITNSAPMGTATVNLVPGADLTCTFVNTRNVDIAIIKSAQGGDTTVAYTILDGGGATIGTPSLTTVGGTGVINAGINVPNSGSVTFSLVETIPAGYQLTGIACTATQGSLTVNSTNLATGAVVLNANAGTVANCVFTNVRRPTVTIRKRSVGGTANFGFALGTNGLPAVLNLDTSAANPQSSAPFTVLDITQPASLTEAVPVGWALTGWECTDPTTAIVASGASPTMTLPASLLDDGNNLVCTFTNVRQPRLRLQKALPTGRFVATDQFTLTIAGPGGPATVVTLGAGSIVTGTATLEPATVGASYTFSEAGALGASLSNYASAYACTNTLAGGQTPAGFGTSFVIVPAAGDDLLCTISNVRGLLADLRLTKTNTPGVNGEIDQPGDSVVSGTAVAYVLTVTNAGPDAANGTRLTDAPTSGLTCTTASCTASGGASCPAATGPALLSELLGGGTLIPVLPAGGNVGITVNCTVD